jgi:hypothetical protein
VTLRSSILLSAAVMGLSLANLPDAKADLCFRYSTGGGILVAKGVKLIEPGTCQPLALFEIGPGAGGAANGMICRDGPGAGGLSIIFHYTYDACLGPGSWFESGTCTLELGHGGTGTLPTIGSSCRITYGAAGSTPTNVILQNKVDPTGKLDDCGGANIPVPGSGGGLCLQRLGFSSHPEGEPQQARNLSGLVERCVHLSSACRNRVNCGKPASSGPLSLLPRSSTTGWLKRDF